MPRRVLSALFVVCSLTLWLTPAGLAQESPRLHTETVEKLEKIPLEIRDRVAENPDGKSPYALNEELPVLRQIEVDNGLAPAATPGDTLRVVSWNIERGRAWEGAAKLIQEHPALKDPDVVFLNEMDAGMVRSGNVHTTRQFAEALGMNYAYGIEFVELSMREDERARYSGRGDYDYHGNAILSKYPLKNARMLRFPGIEKWYGSDEHRLGGRMALFAEIAWNGQDLILIATHLESGFGDTKVRLRQVEFILEVVQTLPPGRPIVFGGDLNATPRSAPVQALRDAGFEVDACNLIDEPTSQRVRDGLVKRGGSHIDYLMGRGLRAVRSEHSPAVVLAAYPNNENGELLSDHAAVAVELAK